MFHLEEEIRKQMASFQKPILFTEKSIEPAINMLHKVLIEGVEVENFRKLVDNLGLQSKDKEGNPLRSIKLYEQLLT